MRALIAPRAFAVTQQGDQNEREQQGDMRDASSWPDGTFDVITAHQNVYYFDAEERATLWESCRSRLSPMGQMVIVTPTSGGPMADYFSLILLSTAGCQPLPSIDELVQELESAGLGPVRSERLIPGDEVWGLVGSTSADSST